MHSSHIKATTKNKLFKTHCIFKRNEYVYSTHPNKRLRILTLVMISFCATHGLVLLIG